MSVFATLRNSSIGSATLNTSREPSRMKISPISSMRRNQMPSTSTTKIGPVTDSEKARLSRNDDMAVLPVGWTAVPGLTDTGEEVRMRAMLGAAAANVHYRPRFAGPREPDRTSKETPPDGRPREAAVSPHRVDEARHRMHRPARRHEDPALARSARALRAPHSLAPPALGVRDSRPGLAGAAPRARSAMAQGHLRRGDAHGGFAHPGAARHGPGPGPAAGDPLGQLAGACADDPGGDAGACAGRADLARLLADEPGPRQAEVHLQPDQPRRGAGPGRQALRQ